MWDREVPPGSMPTGYGMARAPGTKPYGLEYGEQELTCFIVTTYVDIRVEVVTIASTVYD